VFFEEFKHINIYIIIKYYISNIYILCVYIYIFYTNLCIINNRYTVIYIYMTVYRYICVIIIIYFCVCVLSTFCLYFTGKPFDAQPLINQAVSNIICCLVFGERFEYSDKQHQFILQSFNELLYLEGGFWAHVSRDLQGVYFSFLGGG